MSDKKLFDKRMVIFLLGLLLLALVSVGILVFRGNLQEGIMSSRFDTLKNVLEQQRFTFASRLLDQKNTVQIYADLFETSDDMDKAEVLEKLNIILDHSTFENLTLARANGTALENTGKVLNLWDREYFQRALAGETVIDGPVLSKVNGEHIITFATPISRRGREASVLVGVYSAGALSELLMPSFEGGGYAYVTTAEGEIIFKTGASNSLALYSNLFDAMDTSDFLSDGDGLSIRADAALNNAGSARYRHDGEIRFMSYTPVGINDWYIFSVAPEKSINPESLNIMYKSTRFMLFIALIAVIVFIFMFREQKKHMEELREIAFVDTLTGAFNKKQFVIAATELLTVKGTHYAFGILDIDKFKVLNDTLGYPCGDTLLRSIASILKEHMQTGEIFCRCDSDEFYLLITYKDDTLIRDRMRVIMTRIETVFNQTQSDNYNLVLCMGIYVITNYSESINIISDRARHAHHLIKGKDESGIAFYNEEIRSSILHDKLIENRMHDALANEEFLLYLQPQYYLDNERIYGAEALARWRDSDGTIIYPNDFIPVFEKTGFITKLDMYMLEKACQTIQSWIDARITPVPISINFSRLHLKNDYFVDEITTIVDKYNVPAHLIEIELTESSMMNNEETLIRMLEQLHARGFALSMDDFGSGYSSLGLLKNLPVDAIKLDRTFFVDCCELKRVVMVVSGVITMAKNLGIKTVAEGVETYEQVEFLRELGCDIVQGYYYARPTEAQTVTDMLKSNRRQAVIM